MSNLQRHLTNRGELLAALEAVKASWADEDRVREAQRAAHLTSFERGLADVDALIVAEGGKVPEPVEAASLGAPDPTPEPQLEPAPEPETL
jgi:hypothetical protein